MWFQESAGRSDLDRGWGLGDFARLLLCAVLCTGLASGRATGCPARLPGGAR